MISKAVERIELGPAKSEPGLTTNQKIFRAIAVVGVCTILAKFAGTGKELAVAAWFGRGDAVDAFLIALLVPTTVVGLSAGSLSGALIPTYIRVLEQEGRESAQQLFSNIQLATLVFMGLISVIVAAGAHFYLPLLGSGFNAQKLMLTENLLYVLLPFMVLNGTIVVWSAVLNAGERFALPALTPAITPLTALLFLLTFGRGWGVFSLALGTVAGSCMELFVLGLLLRARGMRLRPQWSGTTPELKLVLRQFIPVFTAAVLMSTAPIIDQSMAAALKGGSVAALLYGNRIVNVVTMLTSSALATAVLPYLSQMIARENWSGCRQTLKVYCLLTLAVTVPITLGLVAGSYPLTRLLYQRGAFTAADTAVVAKVQACFALMIPSYTWCGLFARFIAALHRNQLLAYVSLLTAILNVLLNMILMNWMGVAGIALSTASIYSIACVLLGFGTLRSLREAEKPPEQAPV